MRSTDVRELAGRLALLLFGVVSALLLLESVVHLVEAARGPILPVGPGGVFFMEPDPRLGWRHVPSRSRAFPWPEHPDGVVTLATNELGLREDDPTPLRPPASSTRAVVLGDSHTDGLVNNDESWPNVLEARSRGTPTPFEVLNAGVSGYDPWQYYEFWRILEPVLRPEVVLVGLYLGNDLINARRPTDRRDPAPGPSAENARGRAGDLWTALRAECRLCALASLVAHRTLLGGPTFEESSSVRGTTPEERQRHLSAMRHCIGCLWQSLEQRWLFDEEGEYLRQLESVEETLGSLDASVREAGASLIVVLIPSKLQVEPAARADAAETAELLGIASLEPPLEDRFEDDVKRALTRLGIEFVEVRPALEEVHERTGRPLYYASDWHLNPDGSRIVGEVVASVLLGTSVE